MPKLATLKIQPAKIEWILANPETWPFFRIRFSAKKIHSHGERGPKWKIAHIWQSKEHKNNNKTPKNKSVKGFQSWPDVLQHPVVVCSVEHSTATSIHPHPMMLSILFWILQIATNVVQKCKYYCEPGLSILYLHLESPFNFLSDQGPSCVNVKQSFLHSKVPIKKLSGWYSVCISPFKLGRRETD